MIHRHRLSGQRGPKTGFGKGSFMQPIDFTWHNSAYFLAILRKSFPAGYLAVSEARDSQTFPQFLWISVFPHFR